MVLLCLRLQYSYKYLIDAIFIAWLANFLFPLLKITCFIALFKAEIKKFARVKKLYLLQI